jgi:hypothetical protein
MTNISSAEVSKRFIGSASIARDWISARADHAGSLSALRLPVTWPRLTVTTVNLDTASPRDARYGLFSIRKKHTL